MENKKSLDHLFAPKDSSPSSSNSIFESIFSQPSTGRGKDSGMIGNQSEKGKYGNPSISGKDKNSVYENETAEPCYLSSSIYYGGQENYSPRTNNSETQHTLKKDDGDDDSNGSNSKGTSRGNWWKGSLYY